MLCYEVGNIVINVAAKIKTFHELTIVGCVGNFKMWCRSFMTLPCFYVIAWPVMKADKRSDGHNYVGNRLFPIINMPRFFVYIYPHGQKWLAEGFFHD